MRRRPREMCPQSNVIRRRSQSDLCGSTEVSWISKRRIEREIHSPARTGGDTTKTQIREKRQAETYLDVSTGLASYLSLPRLFASPSNATRSIASTDGLLLAWLDLTRTGEGCLPSLGHLPGLPRHTFTYGKRCSPFPVSAFQRARNRASGSRRTGHMVNGRQSGRSAIPSGGGASQRHGTASRVAANRASIGCLARLLISEAWPRWAAVRTCPHPLVRYLRAIGSGWALACVAPVDGCSSSSQQQRHRRDQAREKEQRQGEVAILKSEFMCL